VRSPVVLTDWTFDAGCFMPDLQSGNIVIRPGSSTAVHDAPAQPGRILLKQNYPNPVVSSPENATRATVIEYELPAPAHARLSVYDALGRPVRQFSDEEQAAGAHRITLDMKDLPVGVYVYSLSTPSGALWKRMVVGR
jgi:hypothetical protein